MKWRRYGVSELIYIAEDEKHIRDLEKVFLEKAGYEVQTFETGEELLNAYLHRAANLLILDIMLPDMDGLTLCANIRVNSNVPIIFVSAKDKEIDIITGISLGSDDYLTKPFSPVELVVRVQALFRRIAMQTPKKEQFLKYGDLKLDQDRRLAYCKSESFDLTQLEFDILSYLILHQEKAVAREELLRNIWDYGSQDIDTRATDDSMKRLRKKLSMMASEVSIVTVRGYGFRLEYQEKR